MKALDIFASANRKNQTARQYTWCIWFIGNTP